MNRYRCFYCDRTTTRLGLLRLHPRTGRLFCADCRDAATAHSGQWHGTEVHAVAPSGEPLCDRSSYVGSDYHKALTPADVTCGHCQARLAEVTGRGL